MDVLRPYGDFKVKLGLKWIFPSTNKNIIHVLDVCFEVHPHGQNCKDVYVTVFYCHDRGLLRFQEWKHGYPMWNPLTNVFAVMFRDNVKDVRKLTDPFLHLAVPQVFGRGWGVPLSFSFGPLKENVWAPLLLNICEYEHTSLDLL